MFLVRRLLMPLLALFTMGWLAGGVAKAEEQDAATKTPDQTTSATDAASAPDDDHLHVPLTIYLWAPGLHGTLGAHGYNTGVRATPRQLLSHFHLGLMAMGEIRKKRLLSTLDFMWVNLDASEGRATPFPDVPTLSAKAGFNQIVLTPKVGFRVINNKNFTIDGLAGIRYWNLGTTLNFTPAPLGRTYGTSLSWVDPVVGMRFQAPLNNFLNFTLAGDVGGWGAGSQMDYQIFGGISYKLKPTVLLEAGWRYLFVNYRSGSAVYEIAESGAAIGITFDGFKPK